VNERVITGSGESEATSLTASHHIRSRHAWLLYLSFFEYTITILTLSHLENSRWAQTTI
jgi:hypothetical protein